MHSARRRGGLSAGVVGGLLVLTSVAAAQDVPFTTARVRWDAARLGNHRAVVRVAAPAPAVRVVIPWRRPDPSPTSIRALVVDAATGQLVLNVRPGRFTRESGELWFEPTSGAGEYYVYYLPYRSTGRNYPVVTYLPPARSADLKWLRALGRGDAAPRAVVREIQSIDALHSFWPMEVIATRNEVRRLLASRPGASFLVFPEDREHPIRLRRDLPMRWARAGVTDRLTGDARRGEYFAFQLGVYAVQPLTDVRVRFSDLVSPGGTIEAAQLDCLNGHGTNWNGRPFVQPVDVAAGAVQAMWCGLDVPRAAAPGAYGGTATVTASGRSPATVQLAITVRDSVAPGGEAEEPWKQTRLKWLNSTLAQANDVVAPYTPLTIAGTTIGMLGRRVRLGPLGLPAQVQTYFAPTMTRLVDTPKEVLAAPVRFVVTEAGGRALDWRDESLTFVEQTDGTVRWSAAARTGALDVSVTGAAEFDGFVSVAIALTASRAVALDEVQLDIPYHPGAATYMMGLGLKGGRRPSSYRWQWDVATRNQDGAWIGDVNGGLFFSLRGENYVRPLNTNFYLQKPLNLPSAWGNAGRGGIALDERDGVVLVRGFSGPRAMQAGETLHFDVVLIVTPFHPIDTDFQWRTRFYHRYAAVDAVRAAGATVVNVHHATPINPWINYPFITFREMKAYVDEAHAKGLAVKIYNTVRELSTRAYELFALRSLGHEIFSPGPGGGFSWLQEHLGGDYIAGWFVPEIEDAAVVTSGMSRWHNYYVEGMHWLAKHVGIDGVYLDDVAFDRTTMKRVKRALTDGGRPGIIDLHSANQFNKRDGFINSAVLYLEHFPYINRLWFGEYFDYESSSPDYFLTEISGIPFGLMGEMLEGGGNPWRGMVFGMTSRMPWNERSDPRPIWKAWDDFDMQGTEMIGYWVAGGPVTTSRADVLATVYRKPRTALVAVASWAEGDVDVTLRIDWASLGIDPARAVVEAPPIENFQAARTFRPGEPLPVAKGRGWMLVLREAGR